MENNNADETVGISDITLYIYLCSGLIDNNKFEITYDEMVSLIANGSALEEIENLANTDNIVSCKSQIYKLLQDTMYEDKNYVAKNILELKTKV